MLSASERESVSGPNTGICPGPVRIASTSWVAVAFHSVGAARPWQRATRTGGVVACRTVGPVQLAAQRQVRVGDVDLGDRRPGTAGPDQAANVGDERVEVDVEVGGGAEPGGSGAVESSLWPLVLGVGIMLVANGFVLGLWLLVPGLALVLRGLVGMVTERPSPSR